MTGTLPLADKRILITRSNEQATYFSAQVQALGGTSLEVPLIQFQLPPNSEAVKADISKSVHNYEWIVFTSVNGVRFFLSLYESERPLTNRVAAVGKKTSDALEARGIRIDLVPEKFSAEDLVESFKELSPTSVLLIQGNLARPLLREELMKMGYNVKQIIVYENKLRTPETKEIKAVRERRVDVYTFTSPSTVHNFIKVFGQPSGPVAVIGPITRQAAENAGLVVDICPEDYTVDGLLDEIVHYFQREDT
jgi:uroporphyrinogen-III synthase